MQLITLTKTFALSCLTAALVLPILAGIATRAGMVDHPGLRKVHYRPVPLVGGIGMALAVLLTGWFMVLLDGMEYFMAGMLIMLAVGIIDDLRGMGHRVRFLIQAMAIFVIAVPGGLRLMSFGDLLGLGDINVGALSLPVTLFCCIGVINAVNMSDGLDALAGGIALIAFSAFALMAGLNGQTALVVLCVAFCGAIVGFLFYNFRNASIFMGDAGSLSLGFSLAYLSLAVTQGEQCVVRPMASLLILAVPITDTIIIMTNRALAGKSPFHADKMHLHHILMRVGFGKTTAVLIMLALTVAFALIAWVGESYGIQEKYLFLLYMTYFFSCFAISRKLRKFYRMACGFIRSRRK